MGKIETVAVFCGSRTGKDPAYMQAATSLGEVLIKEKMNLVYGGGDSGLMGAVAKVVDEAGLKVTGVIPIVEGWDVPFSYGETINVQTMEERKLIMTRMADAFIALPGGFGTMDELMEVVDKYQNALHDKPTGILNVNNYYDKLLEWINHAIEEGFMFVGANDIIVVDSDAGNLINKMKLKSVEVT